MTGIAPCFWFNDNALEAANFYTGIFPDSRVECVTHYVEGDRMPVGTPLTVRFTLCGQEFDALNGGPVFTLNPSVSLYVCCDTEAMFDSVWAALSADGFVLMEVGEYPFSPKFGWVADRFGMSWQVSLDRRAPEVVPFLMFCGEHYGKAEQAMRAYCGMFPNSGIESLSLYAPGEEQPEGTVRHAVFTLEGRRFMAIDSAAPHAFTFNEAASLLLHCPTQADIDRNWATLTADGGEESVCGWLRDRYGVWWQIVNQDYERMIDAADPERAKRVMNAMYGMRKPDMKALQDAFDGKS